MIINFPRSHLINGFLRRDCHLSPSCGTEPGALHLGGSCQSSQKHTLPWAAPSPLARSPGQSPPVGKSASFTLNSVHPPCWFLSLTVELACWLKGDPGSLALAEGRGGDVQGKPETESCEVSDLCDPEDPGSRSPQRTVCMGTQCRQPPVLAEPAEGVLQTPPGGSCSPRSFSAALGTRAGCECVRAGGWKVQLL